MEQHRRQAFGSNGSYDTEFYRTGYLPVQYTSEELHSDINGKTQSTQDQ
jgi:hypothetical protein